VWRHIYKPLDKHNKTKLYEQQCLPSSGLCLLLKPLNNEFRSIICYTTVSRYGIPHCCRRHRCQYVL
jgi:hypothetical protein